MAHRHHFISIEIAWDYIEQDQQVTDNAASPLMAKLHCLIYQLPEDNTTRLILFR